MRKSIQAQVDELEAQGINKIILLTHVGLGMDKQLATEISGVDVIVGGHTHSLLSNTDSKAEGPYPIIVKSPRGELVAIVSAYSRANYIGQLTVSFNVNGQLVEAKGEPIVIDSKFPEDPQSSLQIETWKSSLKPYFQKVVGEAQDSFIVANDICRLEECAAGNLLTDVLMWSARDATPDIAVINGGSIRSTIPKGQISLAGVFEALPFQNTVSTFKLIGKDVRSMLETGVSRSDNRQNDGTGRFLQVSGIKFRWDPKKPVGARVSDVEVRGRGGKYAPLKDNKEYVIVTVDFIRRGGDGFDILKE